MDEEQNFQIAMARLEHRYNMEYQMIQATAAFEHAALKPLFLLNGGAAAGFTALYGALEQPDPANAHLFVAAVMIWIVGLLFAVAASSLAAMSQFNFRKYRGIQRSAEERTMGIKVERDDWNQADRWSANGLAYRTKAVAAGFLSLGLFALGLMPAMDAVI